MSVTKKHLEGYSYCPAENAGYKIIDHSVFDDLDGTKLGVVLGKNESGSFVTWEYSYYPKTNFFNGFNHGYYFGGAANEYNAQLNFHNRIIRRMTSCVEICDNSADKMTTYVSDLKSKIEKEHEVLREIEAKQLAKRASDKIVEQSMIITEAEADEESFEPDM